MRPVERKIRPGLSPFWAPSPEGIREVDHADRSGGIRFGPWGTHTLGRDARGGEAAQHGIPVGNAVHQYLGQSLPRLVYDRSHRPLAAGRARLVDPPGRSATDDRGRFYRRLHDLLDIRI